MKVYLWGLVCGISLLLVGASSRAETIKMSYATLRPYVYQDKDTGHARGAAISYFEAVAAQMGYTVEWDGPYPIARLIEYLKTGYKGTVGVVLMPKYPETEVIPDFPDAPYSQLQPVLAVRQENPLQAIRQGDDIRGYRIGFLRVDQPYTVFLETHRDQLHFETIAGEEWARQNLQKLVAGRLDAVFDRNAYTLLYEAIKLQITQAIKILPLPDPPTPVYVGFTKVAPQSKRLVEQYNAAVNALHLNFEDLLQKEFATLTSKQEE